MKEVGRELEVKGDMDGRRRVGAMEGGCIIIRKSCP